MSWVERAKAGDKVVFVDDSHMDQKRSEKRPTLGGVYTIREIIVSSGGVAFTLNEIVNKPKQYSRGFGEYALWAWRFRPVKNTDAQVEAIKRAALDVPAKSPETVA